MTAIEVRDQAVRRMLAPYEHPRLEKRADHAEGAAADVLVGPMRDEARRVSRRMADAVHEVRRDAGVVVEFDPRIAPFRLWVIGGTRDHGPASAEAMTFQGKHGWVTVRKVRGVPANPIPERVRDRLEGRAVDAFAHDLERTEG